MQQQKTATLTAIFSEVLANLAFLFTDDEQGEPVPGETWLETEIGYAGPTQGTLRFRCTKSFSVLLAANLLGINPEDPDAESKAEDAAREFMNIVCGQFITSTQGSEAIFDLTIPKTRELYETPDFTVRDDPTTATLSVEGQYVQLSHIPGTLGA